jgi:hypothetical protein
MAKIIMPLLSGEARGKIGDIVFTKRYGKTIARKYSRPSQPRTLAQKVVRYNFRALNQIFKGSGDLVYQDTTDNKMKVKLWKYDKVAKTYTEIPFEVLSDTEKEAWKNYAMKTKGYKGLARNMFIAANQKLLSNNQNPIRTI